TGTSTTSYKGSVTGTFTHGTKKYYSVTISNPSVTFDLDGNGALNADVSSMTYATDMAPAEKTNPTRVTVATFESGVLANDAGRVTLTATPDWSGVLPANSQTASDLEIPDDRPFDGESFHPELLGALLPSLRAHFYNSSTTTTNPDKAPAEFAASIPAPKPKVGNVTTTYGKAATLSVTAPADGKVTVNGLGTKPVRPNQTVTFATPKTLKAGKT